MFKAEKVPTEGSRMAAEETRASLSTVRVGLGLPFPANEVAEYLFRPSVVAHWLGSGCELAPVLGFEARLPHATAQGPSQRVIRYERPDRGSVCALAWPAIEHGPTPAGNYELVIDLDAPEQTRIALRISPRPRGRSRLRIEHSGLSTDGQRFASLQVWQAALKRVYKVMSQAWRSARRERQAVILVHGIGEQRPGQMLREFVSNVFGQDARERFFVKPDHVSSLFEMRMATVPRFEDKRPTTDVYELYWAHLIRDTTLAQVYGWVLRLILAGNSKIPKTLIRIVWLIRVAGALAAVAFIWLMTLDIPGWLKGVGGGLLVGLPAIATFAFKAIRDEYVIGYAGDAARYLEPRADNISRRQEIREAGAKLLDALHDNGRYARIVVYGHSLGSVIAYDILSHAWGRRARDREDLPVTTSRALAALEGLLNSRPSNASVPPVPPLSTSPTPAPVAIDKVQAMQHAAWMEYRRNGFKWRISDFVTVGSPLAHARWLLKLDSKTEFADLVRDRSMPTCPPQTEDGRGPTKRVFTFTHAYPDHDDKTRSRSVLVPHHGGLFALTRWTNLYFPHKGLINGDPVAGPVADCFGNWVRDVPLRETKGFAHTRYTNRAQEGDAVDKVREALNLPFSRPLADHAPRELEATVLR